MSLIMTKDGWKQLSPVCTNEVWELVSFNDKTHKYEPDSNGQLMHTGYTDHIKEAPPLYRGPLPSMEARRYILKQERDHEEWVETRNRMIEDRKSENE